MTESVRYANDEDNAELVREGKSRQHRLDQAVRHVLEGKNGRYVLQWILELSGYLDPIAAGSANTLKLLGRRDLGLEIREQIRRCDRGALVRMEDEYEAMGRDA